MLIRETTDHLSALAVTKYGPGARVPLLASAAGHVYLAFVSPTLRQTLVSVTLRDEKSEGMTAADLHARLARVRSAGYAVFHRPMRVTDRTTIAVPVLVHDRPLGALVVRFARSAVRLELAIQKFREPLMHAARQIAEELTQKQRQAEGQTE